MTIGRDRNSKVKQCVLKSGTAWHVLLIFPRVFHSCVKLSWKKKAMPGCVGMGEAVTSSVSYVYICFIYGVYWFL